MTQTFYITTPIYYANSLPHLGHLYSTIVADVIQRHKKQRGFETYFLTGTDEHGINIQRAAEKNGRSPKEQVDYISGELKRMFHDFGLDAAGGGYDVFMRTTEPFHYEGVQHLWREIAKNKTPKGNDTIYKGFYEGWFCAPCAEFKTEGEYRTKASPAFATEVEDLIEFLRDTTKDPREQIFKALSAMFGVMAYLAPLIFVGIAVSLYKQDLDKEGKEHSFYWRIYLGALLFTGSVGGLIPSPMPFMHVLRVVPGRLIFK